MKKVNLLFTIALAFFFLQANAQYTFNVCGYVSSTTANTPAANATLSGYITQNNGTTLGQFSATTDSSGYFCTPYFTVLPDTGGCAYLGINISASISACNTTQTFTFSEWLCMDSTVWVTINGCDTTTPGCSVYINDSTNITGYLAAWGSGTAPFMYEWNTGETTSSIAPTTTGQYCVTVTDANGCTATDCYYYGNNTGNCLVSIYEYQDSITGIDYLYASVSGTTNAVTYQWQANGVVLGNSSSYAPNAPGQYCVVISDSNCTATACYYYGQNTTQCSVVFSSFPDSSNTGSVLFYAYASGTAPFVYNWTFSDGSTSSLENPVHTFISSNGWDWACVEITDASGCVSSYCDYVYVSTNNSSCYASFGGYFNDINGTPGEVFFTDYSSLNSNSQVVGWSWSFGDGTGSSLQNPSHVFASIGFYTVCLTITDAGGCTSTYCETWYIDPAWWNNSPWGNTGNCNAGFIALQDSTLSGMVYIVDLSYGSNLNYTWTFVNSNGTINQTITANYPFINFTQFGCVNVCLTVTDTVSGCTASYCDSICVDSLGNMNKAVNWGITVIPTAMPQSVLLAKEEMNPDKIGTVSLFPNPANDNLNLEISLIKSETVQIEMLDFTGRVVNSAKVNFREGTNNFRMDLNQYAAGIYFVKLNSGSINYSEKVVKMK